MSSLLSAAEIREAFLKFFEERGHRRVGSSSLVPQNDPTLLFTNAGMVQFKDVFTGRETRDYSRATSTQKCVRAGGKHNDLDNVGFTARHHTFFEMLGNFSFGDYFKADAIAWGWEFVTRVLGLPPERLSVTVFRGEEGIPADEEAFELWAKTGVSPHRIRRLGLKDNFWAMGDVGPCGPCSEIYVYLPDGPVRDGEHAGESDNWLEIWNLVFMQYERKVSGGPLVALPKPSIDTGAGLERVSAVVQGKKSNYETDLFVPLLAQIEARSGKTYLADTPQGAAMRIIADHARATAFLVADGVQPSNEGRGYVLRRIMRRAIRQGDEHLGLDAPFFHGAVDAVLSSMGDAFPEMRANRAFLLEVTKHEEESFRRTLRRGLGHIAVELKRLEAAREETIPGDVVWDLHQTYGFPWDLTQVIAHERGRGIDRAGFEARLEEERRRASAGALGSDKAVADVYLKLAATHGETRFLGYETTSSSAKVLALIRGGSEVAHATTGDEVEVLLDQTPFYAESGGQVGDTGTLSGPSGTSLSITDTQKPTQGLHVHHAKVQAGTLALGDAVAAVVDAGRRDRVRANHSATHLLHKALRLVLGDAVNQKGSVVQADQLRFDFSHFHPMTSDEVDRVEDLVNGWIRDNREAETKIMGLEEAKSTGAVALFGERYGDAVRVVTVHPESTELCGGTHVRRSGDIGSFRVVQEASIASGVRRIVGLTGADALHHARNQERLLKRAADLFKAAPADLPKRIEVTQRRARELEKRVEELQVKAQAGGGTAELIQEVNGIKVLTQRVEPADAKILRTLADRYRDQLQSGVVGLGGATADGKALVLVAVTKDLVAKGFAAGEAVRLMAAEIGGRGGGRPDLAQAGGTDASKLPQAFERLLALVKDA